MLNKGICHSRLDLGSEKCCQLFIFGLDRLIPVSSATDGKIKSTQTRIRLTLNF